MIRRLLVLLTSTTFFFSVITVHADDVVGIAGAAVLVASQEGAAGEPAATETMPTILHFLAPHPLAGLKADADDIPSSAMLGHYGKPPSGCEADEKAFQISGVPGMVCAPTCDASGGCPTDLPDGVTARPQCALENRATGDKFCVLICHDDESKKTAEMSGTITSSITTTSTADVSFLRGGGTGTATGSSSVGELQSGMCGQDASCQMVQAGLGICTYAV